MQRVCSHDVCPHQTDLNSIPNRSYIRFHRRPKCKEFRGNAPVTISHYQIRIVHRSYVFIVCRLDHAGIGWLSEPTDLCSTVKSPFHSGPDPSYKLETLV